MKKQTILLLSISLVSLALLLAACGFIRGTGGEPEGSNATDTVDANTLATMSAGTVSARLTQISIETLFAQATQLALVTNTPMNTSTPVPTATLPPPTATPVPPTSTPIPIPCNLASFVTDVTIPDGSSFIAGEQFVKTWRIKNIGSCTWSTSYSVYFYSGNSMSAPAAVSMPDSVKPGQTIDVSISMVAPASTGNFTGNWMLKAANGAVFGVGAAGNVPLTVSITVKSLPTPKDPEIIYDFVANYCQAQWRTNAGTISCPSAGLSTKNGSITRTYAPVLSNGVVDDEGTIITVPARGGDGMIRGQYPKMLIHSGDFFAGMLFCPAGAANCNVTYKLLYQESGNTMLNELASWPYKLSDGYIRVNVDLSALDGKEVIFYLMVVSGGDSTDDYANWMSARITHP